jgi:hypothetical protein
MLIEDQSENVNTSSSATEEMTANIHSVSKPWWKTAGMSAN